MFLLHINYTLKLEACKSSVLTVMTLLVAITDCNESYHFPNRPRDWPSVLTFCYKTLTKPSHVLPLQSIFSEGPRVNVNA